MEKKNITWFYVRARSLNGAAILFGASINTCCAELPLAVFPCEEKKNPARTHPHHPPHHPLSVSKVAEDVDGAGMMTGSDGNRRERKTMRGKHQSGLLWHLGSNLIRDNDFIVGSVESMHGNNGVAW